MIYMYLFSIYWQLYICMYKNLSSFRAPGFLFISSVLCYEFSHIRL